MTAATLVSKQVNLPQKTSAVGMNSNLNVGDGNGASEDFQPNSGSVKGLGDQIQPVPDIRPEMVERAKKLIQTPGYPSSIVTRQVAELIARSLHTAVDGPETKAADGKVAPGL